MDQTASPPIGNRRWSLACATPTVLVKVVPRGSRTSLSGGAPPLADAVLFGMSNFNRVIEVSYDDRFAVVRSEVGVLRIGDRALDPAGP